MAYWLGFWAFTALTGVQFLIRELRSYKPHDVAKHPQPHPNPAPPKKTEQKQRADINPPSRVAVRSELEDVSHLTLLLLLLSLFSRVPLCATP